ncbi:hypothetical protein ACHAXS_014352 [Conticribra weissflogii]
MSKHRIRSSILCTWTLAQKSHGSYQSAYECCCGLPLEQPLKVAHDDFRLRLDHLFLRMKTLKRRNWSVKTCRRHLQFEGAQFSLEIHHLLVKRNVSFEARNIQIMFLRMSTENVFALIQEECFHMCNQSSENHSLSSLSRLTHDYPWKTV